MNASILAAATAMEAVILAGDLAESAGHVEGETGRAEVIAERDAIYEEPHTWLRQYAAAWGGAAFDLSDLGREDVVRQYARRVISPGAWWEEEDPASPSRQAEAALSRSREALAQLRQILRQILAGENA